MEKRKKQTVLTLSDEVHFIIYSQLDKVHIANAYDVASYILKRLIKRVSFRRCNKK